MADYTIDVDVNLGNIDKLASQYLKEKAKIEGNVIKIRMNADEKDYANIENMIKSLSKEELSKITLSVDGGSIVKQLNSLSGYIGKNGKKAGEEFRKNVQEGFETLSFNDLLSKSLGDDKRRWSKNAKLDVINDLKNVVGQEISPEKGYMGILKQVEAYEQLLNIVRELSATAHKDHGLLELSGLDYKSLNSEVSSKYTEIGKIFSVGNFTDQFRNDLQNAFNVIETNVKNFANSLMVSFKELGTGLSGNGTGTGTGNGTGSGNGSVVGNNEEEINRINNEIKELNSQLDEAQSKLEELKKGTDLTKSLDINTKSKLLDSLKMDLQTIAEELISLGDKIPIEKAQRFLDLISTYYKLGGAYTEIGPEKVLEKIDSAEEMIYKKFDPDEEGKIEGVELKSYIDSKAIEEQAVVVQQLTDRIKELEKTKERLSSSNYGSGDGAVGAKVPVEPDATGFIGKIQEQIDASGETVKVKIDVDDSINEIKQKIDDIPSSKEIKLSVVDYDKVPLMADAAGNVQDVFRGTHGVFGNWGVNGVTWFTDELQLATQYADSLAEDGKIIRANLSFKNPLEIFGNGADYDKIDISDTAQAVRDMAEKMGFDIKKMLTDDIVQVAKATGYDGVIFRDIKDGYDDLAHNVFAIVDSIQAKNEELYASVYKNTGEIVKLENNDLPGNYPIDVSLSSDSTLTDEIKQKIDSGKPYYVDPELDPNSTLAQDIQNSINNIKLGEQKQTETTHERTHEVTRPTADGGQVRTSSRQSTTEMNGSTSSVIPISPTQTFDNEIQQNLVSLENYKNTIAEIDRLKLEPETEETKTKLEELNQLADYFASKITTIYGEGGSIDGTFMRDHITGGFAQRLRSKYTDEQLTQMQQIATERYGVSSRMEMPQFTKIGSELSNIEAKSEGMRQSLNKSLLESSSYVKQLKRSFIDLIQLNLELKVETNKKDIEDYQNELDEILSKYPQLQQFIGQFSTEEASWEFVKTDKWNDFLATLPQAHEYLKALGYDFEKMNSSAESPISSGTTTKFFRGVDLRGRESLGEQGIYGQGSVSETPWFSSSLDIAKEYAGVLGEIYSLELDTNKIMTIDAQGEKWTHVLYLGQGEEEESKRLLSLYESLSQAKEKLQEDFGWDGQNDSLLNIMKSSTEAQRAVMEYQRLQMDFNKGINASDKYGYTSTDDLAKMAKEMGYQAIVIKNVMDSESGIIADNMSLLTGSMDGVKNASLQDLSGNVIETYNQEAEAARNNADAQRELAAAKKEVGSQSNETPVSPGGDVTQPSGGQETVPPNTSRFDEERKAAEQAVNAEQVAFDKLIQKLTVDVPNAVDTKTQAFRSEQVEVDNLVDLEIFKLQELANTLQNVFKGAGDNPELGQLKELFDMIQSFGGEDNAIPDLSGLSEIITQLAEALRKMDGLTINTDITDSLKTLKFTPKDVTTIENLSKAITTLSTALSNLGNAGDTSSTFSSINELLKNAEALKDLSKILSASAKERKDAAVQAGLDEDKNLAKSNAEAEKYIDNLTKYYSLQDELNLRKESGKERPRSIKAIADEEKTLRAITEYEEQLNRKREKGIELTDKEIAALNKRKELEEDVRKRQEGYVKDAEQKAQRETKNRIDYVKESIPEIQKEIEAISESKFSKGFEDSIENIQNKFNELQQIDLVDENDIKKAEELTKYIEKAIADIKRDPNFVSAKDTARTKLQQSAGRWLGKNTKAPDDVRSQVESLYQELSSDVPVGRLKEIAAELNRIDAEAQKAGQTGKSFADTLQGSFRNLARYLMSFASFYRIVGIFRNAVNTVKELDSALMEVRKVSSESLSSLQNWQKLTFDQANEVGGTAKQIGDSTAAWLRLGKSFSEAQEAAQASVKLLNVSEFTNIDDATTSLVSMRQAFQDLSYEDFIDKLNGVGDNFSSSTDQLAQGMRNVSAVLKVAGNDIDQSLALLTAANDITQDMSKASMGVRTVALRISGTQEAKQELEEAGEDVSDFIVQTQSKVDAQVRKYTATADNPNGISVLDNNGRLRSTYDILLDISKIYDQIVEKDNQFGTNTSNALLELLAGKTRSNILASILQNPKVLQEAYEQSQNSKGIGQRELDIYLDSVEAKMTKLQNRLQELATVTVDSQWLKDMLDLGTGVVGVISDIVKGIGSLNVAVGAFAGIMLQKSGNGLLNFDKNTGFSSILTRGIQNNKKQKDPDKLSIAERAFGYLNPRRHQESTQDAAQSVQKVVDTANQKIQNSDGVTIPTSFVSNINGETVRWDGKQHNVLNGLEETMKKTMVGGKPVEVGVDIVPQVEGEQFQAGVVDVTNNVKGLQDTIANTPTIMVDFGDGARQAGEGAQAMADGAQAAGEGAAEMAKQMTLGAQAMTMLKNIGGTLLSTFVNIGVTMLASFAFSKMIEGIVYLITYYDKLIERGKEAKEVIDSTFDQHKDRQDTVQNIGKSVLNTEDNVTTEKSIDAIAEKYTKLHKSVNNFTNDNISLTNEDYSEYIALCNQIAEQFPSLIKGYDDQGNAMLDLGNTAQIAKDSLSELLAMQQLSANVEIGNSLDDIYAGLTEEQNRLNSNLGYQNAELERLSKVKFTPIDVGTNLVSIDAGHVDELKKYVQEQFDDVFVDLTVPISYDSEGNANIQFNNLANKSAEDIQKLNEYLQTLYGESEKTKAEILQTQQTSQVQIEDIWASMTDAIGKYLQTSKRFTALGDDIQNAIIGNIANIDTSKIGSEYGGKTLDFIYAEIIEPLSNLDEQQQIDISKLFNINISNETVQDYRNNIMQVLSNIFGDDAEDQYELFGFKDISDSYNQMQQDIINSFSANAIAKKGTFSLEDRMAIFGLSGEELEIANELLKRRTYDTFDELYEAIREKINEKPKDIKNGVLSDIFNDESYKENIEQYKKNLSSLSSALETLRTDGKLTAEAMRDLQETFSDLTDFSKQGIQNAASDELSKLISDTAKGWKDLTPDGLKQLNTYVQNLTASYGELGISAEKSRNAAIQSLYNGLSSGAMSGSEAGLIQDVAKRSYDEIRSQLEQLHPEGLNEEVIWMLALEDRFSDPAADIYTEYNDAVVKWQLLVDMDKTKKDIEKNLQDISDERALTEAIGSMREATGRDANNYGALIELDEREIKEQTRAVENTYEKQLAEAYQELADANLNYESSMTEKAIAMNAKDMDAYQKATEKQEQAIQAKNLAQSRVDLLKENKDTIDNENLQAQAAKVNAEAQKIQHEIAQEEAPMNALSNSLTQLQDDAAKTQNEITKLTNQGLTGTKEQYAALIGNGEEQLVQLNNLKEGWQEIADNRKTRYGEDSELYTAALQKVTEYESQIIETQNNIDQWNLQPFTDQLTEYQNAYTTLQTDATKAQEEITKAEVNHQKVSENSYKKLIANGEAQIKNMRDQQTTLRNLQNEVGYGSEKWRDYQSQIDSLDSSISDMQNNQIGWFESMTSIVSSNAQELSSTLSSAFSEINSETGLTIETMNTLEKQFSDLSGRDVSGIFYQSANGMKLNMTAAEDLVDAEYELQQANLQDVISTNEKIAADQKATWSAREQANQRIDAAKRELSMLQALYDQQKQQFSNYQKFQNAQSSANGGTEYEGMQGYLQTQSENREKGLTGTDEFRAYTEYFSQWGLDTVAEWDRVKEKVQRYLTEDVNGMVNFMDDLVTNELASKENGAYSLALPNVEEAAAKMGMNVEWFRDMIGRAEDYGMSVSWVESELDGRMQIQDVIQKQMEAQLELNKAQREGASEDVISNAKEVVDMYNQQLSDLRQGIDDVSERSGKITSKQIRAAVEDINTLNELKKTATTKDEEEAYNEQIQNIADQNYIKLNNFEVDTDALDRQFENWDGKIKVSPVLDNGIDLLNRPQVEASVMREAGWDVPDGDIATVFSNTITNNEEDPYNATKAVVVTPILPNGEVLTEEEMRSYAEQLLNGEEIDAAIELNMFEGDNVLEQANQYAEALHQMQAMYIPGEGWDDEISGLLDTISSYSGEDLDEVIFGDNTYQNEPLEKALDGILDKFELGQEYGEGLIEVIKQMLGLESETNQEYNKPTPLPITGSTADDQRNEQRMIKQSDNETVSHTQQIIDVVYELSNQGYTPDQIEEMAQDETKDIGVEITGEEDVTTLQNTLDEISKGADLVVRLDQSSIDALNTNTSTVQVDTEGAETSVDTLQTKLDNLKGEAKVDANTQSANAKINHTIEKLHELETVNPSPSIDVTGNFDYANNELNKLNTEINNLHDKEINITVHRHNKGGGDQGASLGGQNNDGVAFAGGNADDKLLSKMPQSGKTLVGEEGFEIHTDRDGHRWQVVGQNGPEFRTDIAPDDIVFNHEQSVKLLKNGHINSRGKAFVDGSVKWGGKSLRDGETSANAAYGTFNSPYVSSEKLKSAAAAQDSNTKATNDNTDAKGKDTKSTKKATKALDRFKKALENLKDWIEVRYQRREEDINYHSTKSELNTKYQSKDSELEKSMKINKKYQDDAVNGLVRYQEQANRVLKNATTGKTKILSKSQAKKLEKKIQNGTIDIEKLSKKEAEFVTAYEQWYNKARESRQKYLELQQAYKELEQQQLDNITEEFDSIKGLAEAIQGTSKALVDLNETKGVRVNSPQNKRLYNDQIEQQQKITKTIQNELSAYAKEMKQAANIFGKNSNEYRAAQTAYHEMETALAESHQALIELQRTKFELDFTPIEHAIDKLKDFGDRLSGLVGWKQASGTLKNRPDTVITESDYMRQVLAKNDTVNLMTEWKNLKLKEIDEQNLQINSTEYKKALDEINSYDEQIRQLTTDNEALLDSIMELRLKAFNKLQDDIKNAISDFDHLKSLMNDSQFFDDNGEGINITERGYANLALIAEQMKLAKQSVADYREELDKLQDLYDENMISEEEFIEMSREAIEAIQDGVSSIEDYKDQIISLYKTQITNENNLLQKNIKARQDALNAKKAYYDYDKTIRSQTKDVTTIQAQIAALSGSSNQAARAELAKLQAQLKEAQDTLADTRYQHDIDMQQQGYDKLSEDAQEILDNTLRALDANADLQEETVQRMLDSIVGKYTDAYETINSIISSTGTVVDGMARDAISSTEKIADAVVSASISTPNTAPSKIAQDIDTSRVNIHIDSKNRDVTTRQQKAFVDTDTITTDATKANNQAVQETYESKEQAQQKREQAKNQKSKVQSELGEVKQKIKDAQNYINEIKKKAQDARKFANDAEKKLADMQAENTMNPRSPRYSTGQIYKQQRVVEDYDQLAKSYEKQLSEAQKKLNPLNSQKSQLEARIKELEDEIKQQDDALKQYQGYKKGSRSTKDELNWLHDNEVIIRKSDGAILQPFNSGDKVFNSKQSENLWRLSQIPTDVIKNMVANPDMSKYNTPGIGKFGGGAVENNNQEIHIDSLFTINGNVTQDQMNQIEQIANALMQSRNFKENLTKVVTRDLTRESKKAGYRG